MADPVRPTSALTTEHVHDQDVLDGMSTFPNGCDFTLHFTADGHVRLGYGCYGVHWNLVQGARYRLSRWLGMNGERQDIDLHPETLRALKARTPCLRCGGFTFEPMASAAAPAGGRPTADAEETKDDDSSRGRSGLRSL